MNKEKPIMDSFSKRNVGSSELKVSPFGFGAGHIPRLDATTALETVNAAYDIGVRFFDTAPWYGIGASERRLGIALNELRARDQFAVNTKVGRHLHPEPIEDPTRETVCWDGSPREVRDRNGGFRVHFQYTYDAFLSQHHDSLQRTGLSRFDTLTIHDLDLGYHNRNQLENHLTEFSRNGGGGALALEELKKQGKIKAIGLGCNREMKNFATWEGGQHEDLIERLMAMIDLDFLIIAGPYTLLDTSAMNRIYSMCVERNISWIIASPFSGGWLTSAQQSYMYGQAPEWVRTKSDRIRNVCAKYEVDIGAAALQFVLANPRVAATIPGAISKEEITENHSRLQVEIPQEFWQELKASELLAANCPVPS